MKNNKKRPVGQTKRAGAFRSYHKVNHQPSKLLKLYFIYLRGANKAEQLVLGHHVAHHDRGARAAILVRACWTAPVTRRVEKRDEIR